MVIIINSYHNLNDEQSCKFWAQVPSAEDLELTEIEEKQYEETIKQEFYYTDLEDEAAMIRACIYDSQEYKIINDLDALKELLQDNDLEEEISYEQIQEMSEFEVLEALRTKTEIEIQFQYTESTVIQYQLVLENTELSILDKIIDTLNLDDFCVELPFYAIIVEFETRTLHIEAINDCEYKSYTKSFT